MKTTKANIINFFELSGEWQEEAKDNLGALAEENLYLEPTCYYGSNVVLWDLAECMHKKVAIMVLIIMLL